MVLLASYHLHLGLIDHEDNFNSAVNGFGRFDSSSFSRCESVVFSIQLQYAKTILASCSSSGSSDRVFWGVNYAPWWLNYHARRPHSVEHQIQAQVGHMPTGH
jgi:hypothetical protein